MDTDTTETDDIIIDEGLRTLIPALADEEAALLEQSIAREGCKQPLALWGRTLIDGHHRHAICTRLGVAYRTEQVPGLETRDDVVVWMARTQLGRRNAGAFVRAELALTMKAALARQAKARQGTRTDLDIRAELPGSQTRDALAAEAGISARNVSKVERVLADGVPELVERARAGSVSINLAERVARHGADDQHALLGAEDVGAALTELDARAETERREAEHQAERERAQARRFGWMRRAAADAPDVDALLAAHAHRSEALRAGLLEGLTTPPGEPVTHPELVLNDHVIGALPPSDFAHFQALERDIVVNGCREPLLVGATPEGDVLVDGLYRYLICQHHRIGFETTTDPAIKSGQHAAGYRAMLPIYEAGLSDDEQMTVWAKSINFLARFHRSPFAWLDADGGRWRYGPTALADRVRWLRDEYEPVHVPDHLLPA